jgi:hypothetical protein
LMKERRSISQPIPVMHNAKWKMQTQHAPEARDGFPFCNLKLAF